MHPVRLRARVLFAGGAASAAFAFVWERVLRAGAVGQTGAGGGVCVCVCVCLRSGEEWRSNP